MQTAHTVERGESSVSTPAQGLRKFWSYIEERERIRLRKEAGEPRPWTKDPHLHVYKFTNVRRVHDRTTRELLPIYERHAPKSSDDVVLYNCGAYRFFGTAEMAHALGWMRQHRGDRVAALARQRLDAGERVFTGAYIISNNGIAAPKEDVVAKFLGGLWNAAERVVAVLTETRSWERACAVLRQVEGFGGSGFMAKEVLQDYLLCRPKAARDALTWTPVGPGARRGLNRVFGRDVERQRPETVFYAEVVALRAAVQPMWRKAFPRGGALSAHDIQFCLCEFDKLERVRNGEGKPRSLYRPRGES